MSQNLRNQPGEGQGESESASNNNQERKRYEGFEGMNYEQRRQPYNSQYSNNRNRDDINSGNGGKRREEI